MEAKTDTSTDVSVANANNNGSIGVDAWSLLDHVTQNLVFQANTRKKQDAQIIKTLESRELVHLTTAAKMEKLCSDLKERVGTLEKQLQKEQSKSAALSESSAFLSESFSRAEALVQTKLQEKQAKIHELERALLAARQSPSDKHQVRVDGTTTTMTKSSVQSILATLPATLSKFSKFEATTERIHNMLSDQTARIEELESEQQHLQHISSGSDLQDLLVSLEIEQFKLKMQQEVLRTEEEGIANLTSARQGQCTQALNNEIAARQQLQLRLDLLQKV